MIITNKLVWLHLPKTAGTTTEQLFVASGVPLLWNDPQNSPLKHLPFSEHPNAYELPIVDQQIVCNFRRLPDWLISNYQHKRQMMGLNLDLTPVQQGLFWRHNQSEWLPADWWLDRFNIDDSCILLRVDNLKNDFLSCMKLFQPISCSSRFRVRLVPSRNRNRYSRNYNHWYSIQQLKAVYSSNPRWAALERYVYGDLLIDF
ncbi:hypothetical protein [Synechococcus sp. GEYO]|uniref:hypothetical protein n=1 Tax=Synechococcus sp. GEYO TaxID=2575511 RepID=UPI0010BD1154|nr:hypothetical protein [Synechococcus sp. GEYO]